MEKLIFNEDGLLNPGDYQLTIEGLKSSLLKPTPIH